MYLELGGEAGGPLAGPALPEGHHAKGRLRNLPAERAGRSGLPGLMRPLLFISSSVFALHFTEPPISAQLLAFLRVFCMTEGKSSQGKKNVDFFFYFMKCEAERFRLKIKLLKIKALQGRR